MKKSYINFEIHMYQPTEMANALTPTSWFYYLYLHNPERFYDNDHPSRLEISFFEVSSERSEATKSLLFRVY